MGGGVHKKGIQTHCKHSPFPSSRNPPPHEIVRKNEKTRRPTCSKSRVADYATPSLTHPLTHPPTHSLTHSLESSGTHSLARSCACAVGFRAHSPHRSLKHRLRDRAFDHTFPLRVAACGGRAWGINLFSSAWAMLCIYSRGNGCPFDPTIAPSIDPEDEDPTGGGTGWEGLGGGGAPK